MNFIQLSLRYAGALFRSNRTFYLLTGFLIGLILYFYTEDQYEKQLFGVLAGNIRLQSAGSKYLEDSMALRSVRLVHSLEVSRQEAFSGARLNGFKARYLQPITYDLMTGKGACGSNSLVLTRLLMELGYTVRIAQMKVNEIYGGHILVEAKVNGSWAVLDPLYNLVFRKEDGKLASFDEVSAHWDYFKKQVPAGYNPHYTYEGVRYTNWDKIPVILPAIHSVLSAVKGEDWADHVSLRLIMIRKFRFFLVLCIMALSLLLSTRMKFSGIASYKKEMSSGHKLQAA